MSWLFHSGAPLYGSIGGGNPYSVTNQVPPFHLPGISLAALVNDSTPALLNTFLISSYMENTGNTPFVAVFGGVKGTGSSGGGGIAGNFVAYTAPGSNQNMSGIEIDFGSLGGSGLVTGLFLATTCTAPIGGNSAHIAYGGAAATANSCKFSHRWINQALQTTAELMFQDGAATYARWFDFAAATMTDLGILPLGVTQTTVGAAGGASALPATPLGYIKMQTAGGVTVAVPYYNH